MAKQRVYEIDGEKLEKAMRMRCIDTSRASEAMGFASQFIYRAMQGNSISVPGALLLELMFDVPRAEYVTEETEMLRVMTHKQRAMYNMVKRAVGEVVHG